VKSATLDGVPIPITRNGILLVFTTTRMPSPLTLTSETGTERFSFSRGSDGVAGSSFFGALG
jgi:hypothetical protein